MKLTLGMIFQKHMYIGYFENEIPTRLYRKKGAENSISKKRTLPLGFFLRPSKKKGRFFSRPFSALFFFWESLFVGMRGEIWATKPKTWIYHIKVMIFFLKAPFFFWRAIFCGALFSPFLFFWKSPFFSEGRFLVAPFFRPSIYIAYSFLEKPL